MAIFTFRLIFSRKRTPITTEKEAERVPDRVWTVLVERIHLSHARIQTAEPFNPAASSYTDYAIPAQKMNCDCDNRLRCLLTITISADTQTGNVYDAAILNQHPTQSVRCHFTPPFRSKRSTYHKFCAKFACRSPTKLHTRKAKCPFKQNDYFHKL